MAIKVTKNEIDVETEIMNRLSEFGLSIEFDPEEENDDSKEKDNDKNKKEANK